MDSTTKPPVSPRLDSFKPIETNYAGCRFRSRLEARWAVFFDYQKIAWEYEAEGFHLPGGELYLPDFWLPQVSMYAEVKPSRGGFDKVSIGELEMEKVVSLANGSGKPVLILDGVPRNTNYWAIWPNYLGYEQTEDFWCDVVLTDPNEYHLTEGRFYASTGAEWFIHEPQDEFWGPHPAVTAARSARFDHGESG